MWASQLFWTLRYPVVNGVKQMDTPVQYTKKDPDPVMNEDIDVVWVLIVPQLPIYKGHVSYVF